MYLLPPVGLDGYCRHILLEKIDPTEYLELCWNIGRISNQTRKTGTTSVLEKLSCFRGSQC